MNLLDHDGLCTSYFWTIGQLVAVANDRCRREKSRDYVSSSLDSICGNLISFKLDGNGEMIGKLVEQSSCEYCICRGWLILPHSFGFHPLFFLGDDLKGDKCVREKKKEKKSRLCFLSVLNLHLYS